jgi:hypothetical protein
MNAVVELNRCCLLIHLMATLGVETVARMHPYVVYVILSTQS